MFFHFYRKLEVLQLASCICLLSVRNSHFLTTCQKALAKDLQNRLQKAPQKPQKPWKSLNLLKAQIAQFSTSDCALWNQWFWGRFLEGFWRVLRDFDNSEQFWDFELGYFVMWAQGRSDSVGLIKKLSSGDSEKPWKTLSKTRPQKNLENLLKSLVICCYLVNKKCRFDVLMIGVFWGGNFRVF